MSTWKKLDNRINVNHIEEVESLFDAHREKLEEVLVWVRLPVLPP